MAKKYTGKDPIKNNEGWYHTREGIYTDEKEKELLISMLRLKQGEKVLEIGAGTGRLTDYLNSIGVDATGIENSSSRVRNAAAKYPNIAGKIFAGNPESLPLADNSFETALFMISLEFAKDREKALKEALRVARKQVGVGFLNKFGLSNLLRRIQSSEEYKNAEFFTPGRLKRMTEAIAGKKAEISVRQTLYMPLTLGYLAPFLDEALEKLNLPFGNFAVMVIKK